MSQPWMKGRTKSSCMKEGEGTSDSEVEGMQEAR